MNLNGYTVTDRHNRPSVNQRVALRAFFLNDGLYQDPQSISGVAIYRKVTTSGSDSYLSSSNELVGNSSSLILMNFANSSVDPLDSAFDTSNYTPGTTASGIFRTGVGKYTVILDGTVNLSGYHNYFGSGTEMANAASAAYDYWDAWTVKLLQGSDYKVVFQTFSLKDDTFFTTTVPLLLKPTNKLQNRYISLGSKRDLRISTEINIENKNIDQSIKNIFRESVVTSAMIQLLKVNDGGDPLNSNVTVSAYSDTSGLIDVTEDNTIVFTWDTTDLYTHSATLAGTLGSLKGTYAIRLKYNLLNEIIITEPMFFVVS